MTGGVRISHDGGVDIATLDAPATRNALSLEMLRDLRAFVERSTSSYSRAFVIDHEGPAFSSGVDIKERSALAPGDRSHSELLAALYLALWNYPKPVVCRVAGTARGGALGFLACADTVIATEKASFAFSEVRIGVAPALVGALAMARFGASTLPSWLMLGRPFDATVAHNIGMVSDVASNDGKEELRQVLANVRLAAPGAVKTTKALARRFVHESVSELIEEMSVVSAQQFDSPEGREGMAAFVEKRRPAWAIDD